MTTASPRGRNAVVRQERNDKQPSGFTAVSSESKSSIILRKLK